MSLPEVWYEKKNVIMPYNDILRNAIVVTQHVKTYCRRSVKKYKFYVTLLIFQTPSKHPKSHAIFIQHHFSAWEHSLAYREHRVERVVKYECYFASQLFNMFSGCKNGMSRPAWVMFLKCFHTGSKANLCLSSFPSVSWTATQSVHW